MQHESDYIDDHMSKLFAIASIVFNLDTPINGYPFIKELRKLREDAGYDYIGLQHDLEVEGHEWEAAGHKAEEEIDSIFMDHMKKYKELKCANMI